MKGDGGSERIRDEPEIAENEYEGEKGSDGGGGIGGTKAQEKEERRSRL